jgi:hypothetical protein
MPGGHNDIVLENPGSLVYGTILVAALLATESATRENYLDTTLAVCAALVAYWLTIIYADLAGERLQHGEPISLRLIGKLAGHELPLLLGAGIQLLILLGFWAAGSSLETAVTVDTWCAAGLIVTTEIVIAVRADLRGRELVGQTTLGVVLGLLVIAIRLLLH